MEFCSIVSILNGMYDVLCALSILHITNIPILNDLHTSMLFELERNNPVMKRFMAYWIYSYGIIRIHGGYNKNYTLVAISYYIEAGVIANECFIHNTMIFDKSIFVIVFSIFLGYYMNFQYIDFCSERNNINNPTTPIDAK
jgi:hypothetical protein